MNEQLQKKRQDEIRKRQEEAAAEGRTYFTGRCNCYRGHNSNSGRCHAGQGSGLYTLPERQGVCDHCWEHCKWTS